jgi:hypothetical protein
LSAPHHKPPTTPPYLTDPSGLTPVDDILSTALAMIDAIQGMVTKLRTSPLW